MEGRDGYARLSPRLHKALRELISHFTSDYQVLSLIGSIGDTLEDDEIAGLIEDYLSTGEYLHGRQ